MGINTESVKGTELLIYMGKALILSFICHVRKHSNLFRNACSFENWGILSDNQIFPSYSWGIFGHMTCLNQSHTSENI